MLRVQFLIIQFRLQYIIMLEPITTKNSETIWKNRLKNISTIGIIQAPSKINLNQAQQSLEDESGSQHNHHYKRTKLILRQQMNYIQKISRFINPTHIYNIFDNLSINEQALKNQNHSQSLLATVFYTRFINKVQTNKDYVSTFLQSNHPHINMSYVIERFNSFGDQYFHKIANYISLMQDFFNQPSTNHKTLQMPFQQTEKTQKWMESFLKTLRGKAYFIKFLPNNLIFSHEMLQLIGTTIDEFSNQCLNFKCIVHDFFTSKNYKQLLERNCKFCLNFIDFQNDKISLKELIQSSSSQFIDTIRSRDDHLIKVKIKTYMPNPLTFVMQMEQIQHYGLTSQERSQKIEEEQEYVEDMIRVNSSIIEKILVDPKAEDREKYDSTRECGYITKPKKRTKKKDLDFYI